LAQIEVSASGRNLSHVQTRSVHQISKTLLQERTWFVIDFGILFVEQGRSSKV